MWHDGAVAGGMAKRAALARADRVVVLDRGRVADEGTWDELAQCESSGDWSISTGNGYHGGLQFDKGTWSDFGGTTYAPTADGATKEQQIEIATKVRDARGGYGSWPACANKLGLPR